VDVFFILSGFLISTLLLQGWNENGLICLHHFYARWELRLFPALAIVLVVVARSIVMLAAEPLASRNWVGITANVLNVSDWTMASAPYELGRSVLGQLRPPGRWQSKNSSMLSGR
jgi:peptidoglycan/LPS O-acetylase OafA/YrhL